MKVGAITLMTAFLLALPLAAFAGNDPCSGIGDADSDGYCDDVDNCVNTAQGDQLDVDSDGQGDLCDNCKNVPNGPSAGPYPGRVAGVLTPGLQCDTNNDGYGNACDVDLDNNNFALAGDYTGKFAPALATGAFVFVGNNPANGLTHPDAQEVDMDCNNFKIAGDYTGYFAPGLGLGPVMAGRSGITTGAPGCCPPHN